MPKRLAIAVILTKTYRHETCNRYLIVKDDHTLEKYGLNASKWSEVKLVENETDDDLTKLRICLQSVLISGV